MSAARPDDLDCLPDDALSERQFRDYLVSLEAPFLENYARFGARAHRVIGEHLFRALVLADPDDRKILGMRIVEAYLNAAAEMMGLYTALHLRRERPVLETFLHHRLTAENILAFRTRIDGRLPQHLLRELDLPCLDDVEAARAEIPARQYHQMRRAVLAVPAGLQRAARADQQALLQLADGLSGASTLTDRLDWIPGRSLHPDQVALAVLEHQRRRLTTHALSIDEDQLRVFLGATAEITQGARDLIWLYLHVHDAWPDAPLDG